MRKALIRIGILLSLTSGVCVAENGEGYFESAPDAGGARNRICITPSVTGKVNVVFATAYCPNKDCYSPRLDGYSFETHFASNVANYRNESGCKINLKLRDSGIEVKANDLCLTDEHPYFYATGRYSRVRVTVEENDCGM